MTKLDALRVTDSPFKRRYGNFIGGQWVEPASGRTFANTSPVNGRILCEVARSDATDIDRALDLRPGDSDALLLRATITAQTGNLPGAREDWSQIVRNTPDSAAAKTAQANLDRSAKAPAPAPAPAPAAKGDAKGGAAPAKP